MDRCSIASTMHLSVGAYTPATIEAREPCQGVGGARAGLCPLGVGGPVVDPVTLVFVVFTGLSVGSFLNVLADRLPAGVSIVHPPSRCPHCMRRVASLDLVPFFNYLWLRGRCRYCKAHIPVRLPLVEAATGAVFASVVLTEGLTLVSLSLIVSSSIFIAIAVMDLETRLILNRVLLPSLAIVLALYPLGFGASSGVVEAYLSALLGGVAGFLILLLVYLVAALAGSDLGEGDVKLGALMGVATGFPHVFGALIAGFVTSGVVALFLVGVLRRSRKDAIPFGPFLAGGTLFALLTEGALWRWYAGLLG